MIDQYPNPGVDDRDHVLKGRVALCFTLIYNLILIGCGMALPITMIVMGAMHLNDCPAEPLIPVHLVVYGVFCLAAVVCSVFKRVVSGGDKEEEEEESKCLKGVQAVIVIFLFTWLIMGSVWVYGLRQVDNSMPGSTTIIANLSEITTIHPNMSNATTDNSPTSLYCDGGLYWFAFGVITAYWVLVPCISLFICCLWCWAACILGFCCDVNENIRLNVKGTKITVTW